MTTTVYIPSDLLEKVDERASALRLSRNHFIVSVLERATAEQMQWTPDFLEALNAMDYLEGENELLSIIEQSRSSKMNC